MKKIKAYIYYCGEPRFYYSYLILENGMVCYEHICSHEGWMASDLWTRRPERHDDFQRAGYELDLDETPRKMPLPDDLYEKNQNRENYKEFYELLFPPKNEDQEEGEINHHSP